MDHHILVLAISDFYDVKENRYFFNERMDGREHDFSCSAVGQMEVIPQFIEGCKETTITKMILMETALVKKTLKDEPLLRLRAADLFPKDENGIDIKAPSAVDFFKYRMGMLLKRSNPVYESIDVDECSPETGCEELLNAIRREYRECAAEKGDWKLWLDIHGAFREISMTMLSLMQMLTASLPEELPDADLDDVLRAIPIDGVYSTLFQRGRNEHRILDRTSFYRIFTESPLVQYMNYGQHLLEALQPQAEPPFAFISYKRGVEDKKRFAFLGKLKKAGIRYWYDQGIEYGADWAKELERRNGQSDAMIVLACEKYFSPASYQCGKELRDALTQNKPVIFVSIDGFMPKETDHVWRDPETGETARVTKAQIEAIKKQNQIVLTEKDGSIDENYTVQDSVVNKLKVWMKAAGCSRIAGEG
jgi:hypothetical protein